MRLEFRVKEFLGSGDDDPPAATAEVESRGLRPSWARLWGWHPIVPPSSAAVAAVAPPERVADLAVELVPSFELGQ
jgi:hypothetical protein